MLVMSCLLNLIKLQPNFDPWSTKILAILHNFQMIDMIMIIILRTTHLPPTSSSGSRRCVWQFNKIIFSSKKQRNMRARARACVINAKLSVNVDWRTCTVTKTGEERPCSLRKIMGMQWNQGLINVVISGVVPHSTMTATLVMALFTLACPF